MNLVAIETATETVGVAVRTAAGVQAELVLTGRRRHVESLVPAMHHLFEQVGLEPADLNAVAVDLGPGLFTGLRVGVSTAKGLAQSLGLGVIGHSSLEILLRGAAEAGHGGRVLAAVDARRGEVFATVCDAEPGGAGDPVVMAAGLFSPDALAAALRELAGPPVLAIGDGSQRYADVLGQVPGVSCLIGSLGFPPPSALLHLASAARVAPVEPAQVVPLYMREADATSNYAQITRA